MNQPDSPTPESRKPYSPPELEELGTVDDHTHAIYFGRPDAEARPGPHARS